MAGLKPAIGFKEEKDVRIRLLSAAVCILILPIFLSPSAGDKQINSAPFAAVALAGHVTASGRYCDCDGTNCPANQEQQRLQHTSDQPSTDSATLDNEVVNGVDPGVSMMLLTLALLFGFGLRF